MKHGWGKYAAKTRLVEKGYLRKYCNGSKCRKAPETGYCNCILCSQKKQEEIENHRKFMEKVAEINQAVTVANAELEKEEEVKNSIEQFYFSEELKPNKEEKMAKAIKKAKKHEAKESKAVEKKEERKEERKGKK